MRKNNKGQERVFRFVKKFITKGRAETYFNKCQAPCKAIIYRGKVTQVAGDETMVQLWRETQKGINLGVDPFLGDDYCANWAAKYMRRWKRINS